MEIDREKAWAAVLALYGRPGVSASCLLLQDRRSVDVMVLLFVILAAGHDGFDPSDETLSVLEARVADWRRQVIEPLRAARRACAAKGATGLKARIQQAELEAERTSLALLLDAGARLPAVKGNSSDGLVARVCRLYSPARPGLEVDGAIATLQALVDPDVDN